MGSKPLRDLLLPECSADYRTGLLKWQNAKRGTRQAAGFTVLELKRDLKLDTTLVEK